MESFSERNSRVDTIAPSNIFGWSDNEVKILHQFLDQYHEIESKIQLGNPIDEINKISGRLLGKSMLKFTPENIDMLSKTSLRLSVGLSPFSSEDEMSIDQFNGSLSKFMNQKIDSEDVMGYNMDKY